MKASNYFIAQRVREIRKECGYTQDRLALESGLSRPTLVNIEHGKQGIPIHNLFIIAEVLGREVEEFLPSMKWFKKNKDKVAVKKVTYEFE